MSNSYIEHNDLNTIQFFELINNSILIKRYLKEGNHHFEHFESLLKDIFLIHFKYSIYLNQPTLRTLNYEIIYAMLHISQLTSLRKRTVGSTTNTYLAFKLILDGVFESLRGRTLIQSIENNLQLLNDMYQLKTSVDDLKEIASTIDLDKIFSETESELLNQYLDNYNYRNTSTVTGNDWLRNLIDDIFDSSKMSEDAEIHSQIKSALNSSSIDENGSMVQTLMEKLVNQQTDELEIDSSDMQSEIEKKGDAASDDFKEYLKDELEEKLSPYLKEQFLSKVQQQNSQQRLISELSMSDAANKKITRAGKVSKAEQPTQHTAHKISSAQENRLRQVKQFGHSSNIGLSDIVKTQYPDSEFKHLENTLKAQIKKLNLPRIFSKAIEGIDAFTETSKVLGIREQSLEALTFDDVIKMHKRYKKPSFVKFVNKVGRNKLYACSIQHKKKREHSIPIDKVNSSHNIDLLIEDEYIGLALDIEAFENDFYDRYLRDDLLTIDMIRKYDKRKGPIILCYDGSGSMEGVKIEETQSHILSIMEIARIQKRHLILIQFASASEPLYIKEINPTRITAQDILDVLDEFICGGTDFEKPLSKAIEFIKADQHKKSDILFITDGQCEIREKFKETFLLLKRERDFKLYTIIMHAYTYHDYGDIGDISDEVLEIKGQDIGNWNDATNNKLYSLI